MLIKSIMEFLALQKKIRHQKQIKKLLEPGHVEAMARGAIRQQRELMGL